MQVNTTHSPRDLSLNFKPSGYQRFQDIQLPNDLTTTNTIPIPTNVNLPSSLPRDILCTVDENIKTLYDSLVPTIAALEPRKQFLVKFQQILDLEFPSKHIRAHLFGSTVNGLGSISSDVDVCLVTSWDDYRNGIAIMKNLAEKLRHHGMQRIYTISKAKVPICKFYDPQLGLNIDINVNNTMALRNTRLCRNYVDLDPRVRPLLMIIKHWAKQRALNDAAKGGTLSSYCWVMMGINFLQMRQPPILPCLHEMYLSRLKSNPSETCRIVIDGVDCSFYEDLESLQGFGSQNLETLGQLLYAFFYHFALEFDYNSLVMSVRHGCYLKKSEKGWDLDTERMCRYLCVEEPFNTHRNLASSADIVAVMGLRHEFLRAAEFLFKDGRLESVCEEFSRVSKQSTWTTDPGNVRSDIHSRKSLRHFGTGMYPTHHKHQQTEFYIFNPKNPYFSKKGYYVPSQVLLYQDEHGGHKMTQTEDAQPQISPSAEPVHDSRPSFQKYTSSSSQQSRRSVSLNRTPQNGTPQNGSSFKHKSDYTFKTDKKQIQPIPYQQPNAENEDKDEYRNESSSISSTSRRDKVKSVELDLDIRSLSLEGEGLGKKKGSRGTLVWSNNPHHHRTMNASTSPSFPKQEDSRGRCTSGPVTPTRAESCESKTDLKLSFGRK